MGHQVIPRRLALGTNFNRALQSRPIARFEWPGTLFDAGNADVWQRRRVKWLLWIVVLAGLVPVGVEGFHKLRDRCLPKRFGVVEQGRIYRSGQLHRALVRDTLASHHIAVVIDLTHADPGNLDQQAEQAAIRELGLRGERFPMNGNGTGDLDDVARAVATLAAARDAGQPALVHCAAGAQRTGCVIATYRLLVKGDTPHEVLAELQRYGWRPTHDRVLLDFLNEHLRDLAERLVRLGALPKVPESIPRLSQIGSRGAASLLPRLAVTRHGA